MKKVTMILVSAALISSAALAGPAKKKVLVTKTTADKAIANVAVVVGEKLCTEVSKAKKIEAFCVSTLEALLKQQNSLAMLGGQQACTGGDCTDLYAKRVAAEYLITSDVKKLGKKKFLVSVQLIHLADAKTLERFEKKVDQVEKTYTAAAEGAGKVLAKL